MMYARFFFGVRLPLMSRSDLAGLMALYPEHAEALSKLSLSRGGEPVGDARVALRRGVETIESAPTDEQGCCCFAFAPAGRYRLEIRRAGARVGEVALAFLSETGD